MTVKEAEAEADSASPALSRPEPAAGSTGIAPPDGVWSISWLATLAREGRIRTMKFVPDETVPISWNGVTVYVTRGVEIEVPEFHYDIYVQSRKATMEAFDNARKTLEKRTFGPGQTTVESGWNGNSPTQ